MLVFVSRSRVWEPPSEYAWKSEFMKGAGKKMQLYLLLDLVKYGVLGYGLWKTYNTNGAWLQAKISFLTEKISLSK